MKKGSNTLGSHGAGILLILSAPSGAGKSTLARMLREQRSDVEVSVSHTTRSPRGSEVDGVHYHFVSREEFEERIAAGQFAEYAQVYENYYGTSREVVETILRNGNSVVLDIDIQGGEQLMSAFPEAVGVFVIPPSFEELENRLIARSTDTAESQARRLASARDEVRASGAYEYVVVNKKLVDAVAKLSSILDAELARRGRMEGAIGELLASETKQEKTS